MTLARLLTEPGQFFVMGQERPVVSGNGHAVPGVITLASQLAGEASPGVSDPSSQGRGAGSGCMG